MSYYKIFGLIFIIIAILSFLGRKKIIAFQLEYFSKDLYPEKKERDKKFLLLRNYLTDIGLILIGIYLLLFK